MQCHLIFPHFPSLVHCKQYRLVLCYRLSHYLAILRSSTVALHRNTSQCLQCLELVCLAISSGVLAFHDKFPFTLFLLIFSWNHLNYLKQFNNKKSKGLKYRRSPQSNANFPFLHQSSKSEDLHWGLQAMHGQYSFRWFTIITIWMIALFEHLCHADDIRSYIVCKNTALTWYVLLSGFLYGVMWTWKYRNEKLRSL